MRDRAEGRGGTTRDRIVEAALETLGAKGFAGTTARAIAETGGFNQALIFYHFGSVANLLMEAFRCTSDAQVDRYREAASDVGGLSDLVGIAKRLHHDDLESGAVNAVTQLMAAASADPALGPAMMERFDQWIALVEEALGKALAGNPLAASVPLREAAYAICAMFLGIELMTRLDPTRSEADQVFDMMSAVAGLIEQLIPVLFPTGAE